MSKQYKFLFSVVIPVYNVEEYLSETIESVINQTIDFKKYVQIILVNDGSPDNSEEICLKYKELYPNNIVYVKQKNAGVSAARNTGIKYIEGKYVNFMDIGDALSTNTLKEVYNFFKKNTLFVDIVTIPLYKIEKETKIDNKYKYMGSKNRVINLLLEPYNFILSTTTCFYKKELINNMIINDDNTNDYQLYKKNHKIGYVVENNVSYYENLNVKANYKIDILKDNSRFTNIFKLFETFDFNNLLNYQMETIIFTITNLLNEINVDLFAKEEDYNQVIKKYKYYLDKIPLDFFAQSRFLNDESKILIFKLKEISYNNIIDYIPINFNIRIKNYYVRNNNFYIEIIYNNYGMDNIDVVMYDGNSKKYKAIEQIDIDGPYDKYYGNFKLDCTHYRKYKLDLNNKIIKFGIYDNKNDNYIPINKITEDKNTKLILHNDEIGIRYKNKLIKFNGRKFKIIECYTPTLLYNLKTIISIWNTNKKICLMRLFNRRNKKYILINDRQDKAGDNGEALFQYICEKEKDLAKKTYFVIDRKSNDYKRLKRIGKVVPIRSVKHKLLFLNAKYIYSSHMITSFYSGFNVDDLKYYRDLVNYRFIWLQHGITMNGISKAANRLSVKNSKITVVSDDEYKEFCSPRYFYNKNDILLTGFSRYDKLISNTKKIITVCPTWRRYLSGRILENGKHEILEGFDNTIFYKKYKEFLTDNDLNNILEKYNFKLQFVLHPGVSGYKNYFDEFTSKNISIILQEDVIYQKLFEESNLLITDYSSVFFDFSYLKKPIIYFQFDKEDFFKKHYNKGYFSYEEDGFGDVIDDTKELVKKIEYYLENEFKVEKKYIERINKTFKYNDKDNSKRIIDMTIKNN